MKKILKANENHPRTPEEIGVMKEVAVAGM